MNQHQWEPDQYLRFEEPRRRPALDLLSRLAGYAPDLVVDMGCGTGNIARLLAHNWPDATVTGVDSSPEMLAHARSEDCPSNLLFEEGDARTWTPPMPADLIFSNAALHWVGDHGSLFPHLFSQVAPGGYLAVQMPHNFDEPSHTLMVESAMAGAWRGAMEAVLRPRPVGDVSFYYNLLAPEADLVDIWTTQYLHVLSGEDPILEWVQGTALKPLLDVLDDPMEAYAFLEDYSGRLAKAYPVRDDGTTLFPFRRMFMVVRRKG